MQTTFIFPSSSQRLHTLAAGLSPAYIRLGGTDADFLIFDPNQADPHSNSHGSLDRKWGSKVSHVQLDTCDGWKFCKPKYYTNYTMTGMAPICCTLSYDYCWGRPLYNYTNEFASSDQSQ